MNPFHEGSLQSHFRTIKDEKQLIAMVYIVINLVLRFSIAFSLLSILTKLTLGKVLEDPPQSYD